MLAKDYFPIRRVAMRTAAEVRERYINYIALPTAEKFHAQTGINRFVMGHFASGKTVMMIQELIREAQLQRIFLQRRCSRFAIIRNTYPQLKSTTIKTFQQWLPEDICPITYGSPIIGRYRHGMPDGTTIDIEFVFIALDKPKHVANLLSMELTGAMIHEFREVPKAIVDAVGGRVGRFPAPKDGGWARKFVIGDSNPPDDDHWIFTSFEDPEHDLYVGDNPDWWLFKQPPAIVKGRNGWEPNKGQVQGIPPAENWINVENLEIGQTCTLEEASFKYWMDMIPNKTAQWIKVYLEGKYGTISDGLPVYGDHWGGAFHTSEYDLVPIKNRDIFLGWDWGLCYDDQTEVLTRDGWKLFKDVDEKIDTVATRDPKTGRMSYTGINFKVDRQYKGPMLQCETQNVNFCVTPEHRIPYTKRDYPGDVRFAEAGWVRDHSTAHLYVDLVSVWEGKNPREIFGMEPHVFAGFMGIYLSEGCVDKKYGRIIIYQNVRDREIQELLDRTGLVWKYSKYGKTGSWRLRNNNLADFLRPLGKSYEKRIPGIVRDLSQGCLREFIRFFTIGDGHIRTRKNGSLEHVCFTTSLVMAGDLAEIAQKIGWYTSQTVVQPQSSVIMEGNTARVIQSRRIGYAIIFKKKAKRAELLKTAWSEVEYDGRIYCLNVPYHTLYIRRNGRPSWNGNTPACIVGQMMPSGQLRILEEFCATSMGLRNFAENVVRPVISTKYRGRKIQSEGDPSGRSRDYEEHDAFQICNDVFKADRGGFFTNPSSTNDLRPRLESVRFFLSRTIGAGQPAFLIDPRCKMLIRGFEGHYRYRMMQIVGETKYYATPDKNAWSHPHDALQALCLMISPGTDQRTELPLMGQAHARPLDKVTNF